MQIKFIEEHKVWSYLLYNQLMTRLSVNAFIIDSFHKRYNQISKFIYRFAIQYVMWQIIQKINHSVTKNNISYSPIWHKAFVTCNYALWFCYG